jgi:hypothetical protein
LQQSPKKAFSHQLSALSSWLTEDGWIDSDPHERSSENHGFRMSAISDQLSALSKIHLKT